MAAALSMRTGKGLACPKLLMYARTPQDWQLGMCKAHLRCWTEAALPGLIGFKRASAISKRHLQLPVKQSTHAPQLLLV